MERSPAVDLVAADKDIVILRTFSKIYSMAGIRMGLAYGRPDLLQKMRPWSQALFPVTAVAAATASLKVKDLRLTRRESNQRALETTPEFLEAKNFTYVKRPKCNNFMIDVKRPGMEIIHALADKKVMILSAHVPDLSEPCACGRRLAGGHGQIQQGVSRGNGLSEMAVLRTSEISV